MSADKIIQIKIQEGYTPGTGFDQFPFPKGLSALYSLDSQTIKWQSSIREGDVGDIKSLTMQ